MLNIALFGPPGAGKGTQSEKLLKKYNLTYISTGDMLRTEIAEGSDLGLEAKSIIEKGGLVSDELIVKIIEKKIKTDANSSGILFDGFPRTTVQAYILEGLLLKLGSKLNCMISLDAPDEELINRLLLRAKTSGRSDDTLDVIKVRLQEYNDKTKPVAEFYNKKQKYFKVKGVGEIDDIFESIVEVVEANREKEFNNIVLLGRPGSGKGTQGRMLADKHNLVYISTGKLLRAEVANNTDIGKMVKPYMDKGEIVPDEIPIKLIEEQISKNPDADGFIFKGFPRTIVQAYILDGLLRREGMKVSGVVDMKVTTLEAVKRLSERAKTDRKRPYDESAELIVNRLEQYNDKTIPVLDYYKKQDKYVSVKAEKGMDVVFNLLSDQVDIICKSNY
ncbi:MAG: adenylate kinase [Marinilabiliales bacterium]|nr:MAG: adenylate kinase [Marinilabiliales bacterium]